MKGEPAPIPSVTGRPLVTARSCYRQKSPVLQALQVLHVKNSDLGKRVSEPSLEGAIGPDADMEAAICERAGMSADSVPGVYLDAWARLNCQRPATMDEATWRRALDDGGRFLDAWGQWAVEWEWTPGELFDLPRAGSAGGLVWRTAGRAIETFGLETVRFDDGEILGRKANEQPDRGRGGSEVADDRVGTGVAHTI